MRFHSITFKLLSLIICCFLLTGVTVAIAADLQLKKIIDRSLKVTYSEKLFTIHSALSRSNERLKKTGMVEAYIKDFKDATLKELRQTYYRQPEQSIYPFIIDSKGRIILHPSLPPGDISLQQTQLVETVKDVKEGCINYTYRGEKRWYTFLRFEEWNWIVLYSVPLKVKYADASTFRGILILTISVVTLLVLLMLSLLVARSTRPITELTAIARDMAAGKLDRKIELAGRDEIGTLTASFISMRDAINSQLIELKTERNRAENILQATNAGTWEWNLSTNEVRVNRRWAEIRGYTLEELVPITKDTWKQFSQPKDFAPVRKEVDKHLRGEVGYYQSEYKQYKKDGSLVWVGSRGRITARDADNKPLVMSGIDIDITQRKTVEEELYRLQNYLSNIIDSMPSMLVGVDPAGIITQWNREAERSTGVSSEDAIGHSLGRVVPHLSKEMELVDEAINSRTVQYISARMRKDENRIIYEDITIYPLLSNGIEGAAIRIDDVSKERQLEEQLGHHRKMDAIGQLAGGVAHDFNNTLTGIIGAAQLLKLNSDMLDEEMLDFVDIILQSSTRAADLTAKLLAFGRKAKVTSSEIDIHRLIDDTITILNRTIDKKIRISVNKSARAVNIVGDNSAIQSALMNISINASHAMPDGGELIFSTKNIYLNKTYCRVSPFEIEPGSYIEIEIKDTGCGIALENLHKIFEPFYTTKEHGKGTGLGLAAVYGTIQEHHGVINVYSEEGAGTVFHLLFPCSEQKSVNNDDNEKLYTGSGLILLVDDEKVIRVTGKYLLQNMGYKVLLAENGEEAVDIYRERHSEIALVIMDMIMPIMNGREAFYKMLEIDSSCKVIISSGFTQDERLDEMTAHGLRGFIHKPYRDIDLSRLLAKVLSS